VQERGTVPALTRPRVAAVALGTAALVVIVDQLTKWWALEALADGPTELFWTLRLRLVFNTGASFSLGEDLGLTPCLTAGGVVLVLVLVAMTRSVDRTVLAVAFGLMVGGAVGNLSDRLFRGHDGAVIDFVDLQWWPVFNVADTALVIGAGLLVLTELRRGAGPDVDETGNER
jgi:signal peptidase II